VFVRTPAATAPVVSQVVSLILFQLVSPEFIFKVPNVGIISTGFPVLMPAKLPNIILSFASLVMLLATLYPANKL
jgi:hypothetical protein